MFKKLLNSTLVLASFITTGLTINAAKAEDNLTIDKAEYSTAASNEKTWYFAEGNTMTAGGKNLTTFLLIQNSSDTPAIVNVTYMYNGGGTFVKTHTAPSKSKYSINTKNDVGLEKSFSIKVESNIGIVAERAMYWNANGETWADGSTVIGSVITDNNWYFAEGNTMTAGGKNFTTFFLIQNPNPTPMTAEVIYAFADGNNISVTHTIPANSKYSINAKDDIGLEKSFAVRVKTSQQSIVERSMYWNSNGKEWAGGDTMRGIDVLSSDAVFSYNASFSQSANSKKTTFLLVYNPKLFPITIDLTYYFSDSDNIVKTYTIPGGSKFSLDHKTNVTSKYFSTSVTARPNGYNDKPTVIIAEQSIYLDGLTSNDSWTAGMQLAGNTGTYPYTEYPEFNTMPAGGRNFSNTLALTNLSSEPKNVAFFIYEADGKVTKITETIDGYKAKFLDMNSIKPNKIFSVRLVLSVSVSSQKVINWQSNNQITGLHGSMGFKYY